MRRIVPSIIWSVGLLTFQSGCSLNDLVHAKQPAETIGREGTYTEAGALALTRSAVTQFGIAFNGSSSSQGVTSYVIASGLFTDEFQRASVQIGNEFDLRDPLYQTLAPQAFQLGVEAVYANMQYARVTAQLARQALALHSLRLPSYHRVQVMTLEAFAIIHLAELFCSGTPLSDVSLENDIHYRAGSTTAEMFAKAVVLFDSAIAIPTDSVKFTHLARIGKARALLGLGQYAEAAAVVASVPDGFVYDVDHTTAIPGLSNHLGRVHSSPLVHVPDREGGNGINWITANDPRVPLALNSYYYVPSKYTSATSPTPLASAVEARLVEAEAALQSNGASWLTIVNRLRTVSGSTGTGGVAGLNTLGDPGSKDERIKLLFRERAFWLFATGHRQGDLRRLVRNYQWPEVSVYPTGIENNPVASFGQGYILSNSVALRPPKAEIEANSLYTGCFNLNQ